MQRQSSRLDQNAGTRIVSGTSNVHENPSPLKHICAQGFHHLQVYQFANIVPENVGMTAEAVATTVFEIGFSSLSTENVKGD